MLGIRSLTLLSLAAFASAQTLEGVDGCGQTCYTDALNRAGEYPCGAMDMNCLCRAQDFHFAIRDCANNACPPGYMPAVTNAASALCATATLPPGVPVPTEPTSEAPPPTTTTEEPAPTTEPAEVTSTSSTTFETSTTSAPETSSTSETSETSSSSTTSAPGGATKVATGTGTSSADSSAATSEVPAAASDSAGLTEAAKIGIGVGVGAAVIAAAAVVACLMLRKRRESQGPPPGIDRFKISHPMPSDEHAYTHNNNSEYDIGGGDLEMKSRRYEDMLPREEPRQMV